jgi:hypothetical protein
MALERSDAWNAPSTPDSRIVADSVDLRNLYRWGPANHVYTDAGVDIGATTTGAEINTAVVFTIDHVFYSEAAGPQALPFSSGHTDLAASQKCLVAFCTDAGNTPFTVQSSVVAASADDPEWPAIPTTAVCFGGVKIETSSSGTFVFGTEDLNDAEVTDTYYDFNGRPPTGPSSVDVTVVGS